MQSGQGACRRDRRHNVVACLLVCSAWLASGCLRAQARAAPEIPLDMPAPPPRVVEVADPDTPPIIPLQEEPARPTPRLRPAPPRTENRGAEAPKPETVVDPARPVEDVRPAPPTLQTTPTQQELELERGIRGMLAQATSDLNRTNYQALNTDGRTQYDTAKRFISQAEDAVRTRNLVFASNLADKAATLAAQLVGR